MKTYEKLRIRYYWGNVFSDIQHWCKSCCDCAVGKTPRTRHKAPLLPIPVQDAFDRVACDIIEPFPTTKSGNRYILIFTKSSRSGLKVFPYLRLKLLELLAFSLKKSLRTMVHPAPFCLTAGVIFCHLWSRKFVGCSIPQSLTQLLITPHAMVKLNVSITLLLKLFLCLLTQNRPIGICTFLPSFLFTGFRLVSLLVIAPSISFMAENNDYLLTFLFCHQPHCLHRWRNIVRE